VGRFADNPKRKQAFPEQEERMGGVTGATAAISPAELTRQLLGSAQQQQVDLATKMVKVNVAQTVQSQSAAGVGQVLDALA